MLCEICHKNKAEGVLHKKDDSGEDEELYVCKKCLAKANGEAGGETPPDGGDAARSGNGDDDDPPAFIRNFLDAAVGLIEGVTKSDLPKEKKCPVCGTTWQKIKDEHVVGCPDCWALFGKDIRSKFFPEAYGPKHIGKIPEKTSDGKPSKAFLEKELRDAVAKQDYRKAARIRKQLDQMDEGGK